MNGLALNRRLLVVAALVTFVTLIGLPARATRNAQTTADEPHYLLTALSLWEDQSFDYGDERSELRYWPFHSVTLPVQAEIQDDGRRVAPHDPLLPVVLAVPMGLGGWPLAKATIAILAGALAALIAWVLERRVGVRPVVAATAAVIAGCSPPLVVYGTQIYPELPGALAALLAFAAITTPRPRASSTAGAVLAIVAMPWLSVKYAPVAVVLAVGLLVSLWRSRRESLVVGAAAAFAVSAVVFAIVHLALYGGLTPYAAGTHFGDELSVMGDEPARLGRLQRVTGLLVDRDFGLAAWQPLFLLTVPAIAVWTVRARGTTRWLLTCAVGAGWATAAFAALTMHGWWWPGRQTIVVLPLCVVAIVSLVASWSERAQRVVLAVALFGPWSFGWLVGGVRGGRHTLIVDFDRSADPVGWTWRHVLPDLRADTLAHDALHVVWAAVLVASAVLAARRARTSPAVRSGIVARALEVPA